MLYVVEQNHKSFKLLLTLFQEFNQKLITFETRELEVQQLISRFQDLALFSGFLFAQFADWREFKAVIVKIPVRNICSLHMVVGWLTQASKRYLANVNAANAS